MEIIQYAYNSYNGVLNPIYWILWVIGLVPYVGPGIMKLIESTLYEPFAIQWGRMFAAIALGDIALARSNTNCAANTYGNSKQVLQVDKAFASDSDYYLNSIEASQEFYLSILNFKTGYITIIPFLGWAIGAPLEIIKWTALIGLPVVTLVLQLDSFQ